MQEARREALEKARGPDRSREEAEERPPASSADNPTVTVNAIPGDEGGDAAPPDSGLESESNESEGSDNGILPEDEGDLQRHGQRHVEKWERSFKDRRALFRY